MKDTYAYNCNFKYGAVFFFIPTITMVEYFNSPLSDSDKVKRTTTNRKYKKPKKECEN